jgi:hypothetical protein
LRRNCLLKDVIEGKVEKRIEVTRRRKQLLDGFKEKRRYWKMKEDVLDGTLWRTRCGRGYCPDVTLTGECVNE